jgi:hypothetical protein
MLFLTLCEIESYLFLRLDCLKDSTFNFVISVTLQDVVSYQTSESSQSILIVCSDSEMRSSQSINVFEVH